MSRRGSDYTRHEDVCSSGDDCHQRTSHRSNQQHESRRDRGGRRLDEDYRREKEQRYEDDRYEDERRRNEDRRRGGDDRYGHEDERRRSEDRRPDDRRPDDRHSDRERRYDDERHDRQRFDDGRRRDSQLDDERRRFDTSPQRSLTPQRSSLTPIQSRHEVNGSRNVRQFDDRSRDGSDGTDERSAGGTWKSVKHADDLKHLDGGRDGRESDDESEKTEFQSENGTWRPITPEIARRIREAMAEEERRQKQEEARQKAETSRRRSRDLSGSEDDGPKPRRSDASRGSRGSFMRDKTPPRGSSGYSADRSPAGSSAGKSPMKASPSPRSKKFSVDFDMAVEADDVAGLIWKFDPIGAVIRRLPEKLSKAKGIKVGDLLVRINNRNVEGFDRSRIEDIWMQEQDSNVSDPFRLTFVPP